MSYKMLIPPNEVDKTRFYFRERSGVLLWHNQEIGVVRPEMMTPTLTKDRQPYPPPHWAYGNPGSLKPEDIGVRKEVCVELPKEWFPVCEFCEGTGRYPLAKIAKARGISVVALVTQIVGDKCNGISRVDFNPATKTVRCSGCQETGHRHRVITTRVKRAYWGGMVLVSETKARKTARRLAKHYDLNEFEIHHDFNCIGNGVAELFFYTETIIPFVLEGAHVETTV